MRNTLGYLASLPLSLSFAYLSPIHEFCVVFDLLLLFLLAYVTMEKRTLSEEMWASAVVAGAWHHSLLTHF